MLRTSAAAFLALSIFCESALAMGAGGAGGGGAAVGLGVANPLKYYPVCRRGPAGDSCQCRVAGASEASALCRPGEYCNTLSGTCGAGAPRRLQ
jgi:hypothetical protein